MILPIVAYGDPVLRKKGTDISAEYPRLKELIDNMYETMYNAYGVGLAAPQIGKDIRLFIVDTEPFSENEEYTKEERDFLKTFKRIFINAHIRKEEGNEWPFNEGCLSIPGIHEDVTRHDTIHMEYVDENFNEFKETFTGLAARVIQHEYDHIDGVLFTDKISAFKKRLIKGKLEKISKGQVQADYPMKFPNAKK
ncbi:MAG: peptide deformylase [Flavobacteriaceae bacterium]|jgi:peptide deformylase|nr:peptide deformylase [Flavobacteriaceae bacterium]